MKIISFLPGRIAFTLLFGSIISLAFNTVLQKEDTEIYWNADFKLVWEDFMAKPLTNSKYGAISCVGMCQSYKIKNNILEVDSRSSFDKSKSWSKKDKHTNELLKHEQGHFDIAEIFARKLRQEVTKCKFKSKNLQAKFEGILHQLSSEYLKYDNLYDKETDYSRNDSKQLEWNEKIAKELKELEAYSETHIVIKVK